MTECEDRVGSYERERDVQRWCRMQFRSPHMPLQVCFTSKHFTASFNRAWPYTGISFAFHGCLGRLLRCILLLLALRATTGRDATRATNKHKLRDRQVAAGKRRTLKSSTHRLFHMSSDHRGECFSGLLARRSYTSFAFNVPLQLTGYSRVCTRNN